MSLYSELQDDIWMIIIIFSIYVLLNALLLCSTQFAQVDIVVNVLLQDSVGCGSMNTQVVAQGGWTQSGHR